MNIFVNKFILELNYELQLQGPSSFDDMVKRVIMIEDVMIKKGAISLYTKTNHRSNLNKDKKILDQEP